MSDEKLREHLQLLEAILHKANNAAYWLDQCREAIKLLPTVLKSSHQQEDRSSRFKDPFDDPWAGEEG